MSRLRFLRSAGIPAFFALATVASITPNVSALPRIDINDPPDPVVVAVVGTTSVQGLPVLGRSVDVVANLQIEVNGAYYPVTSSTWTLVTRPTGSVAALSGSGLRRTITLDRVGSYGVRVVACPSGCVVAGRTIAARTFNATFSATAQTPVDSVIRLPGFAGRATSPAAYPGASTKCQGEGGVVDPQWVTTEYWAGAASYKLVEGEVEVSKVAGADNFLNHSSQDWNLIVRPDAPYRHLLNAGANPNEIEIEWETNEVPEALRPTNGDRVSTVGYHILDCAHGYRTEIHPPVLWAVHRKRVFQIPSDQVLDLDRDGNANETLGSNVYVSGVVSDTWVNAYSGEITSNGSETGLAQPSTNGWTSGAEIGAPAPLQRQYTYNIYLPKSPQVVAKEWGRTDAKPAPLYFSVKRHPNAPFDAVMGPMPTIVPVTEGDVTYLRVTLDLSTFSGKKIAQQIEAGWVYPSPENWGLENWRLSVPSIKVKDSLDTIWGDWNFWLGNNGADKRWTKIFSCQGCITDDTTYTAGTSPWQNMSPGGLLAEVKLLPNEPLRLTSTGYEDDNFEDNGIARLDAFPAKVHGASGTATNSQYVANYNVLRLGAVTPTLTAAARALHDDYVLTGNSIVAPPPDTAVLYKAAIVVEDDDVGGIKMLGGVSELDAQAAVAKADPARIDATLVRLRAKVDARLVKNPTARSRVVAALVPVANAFPTAAWNLRFGDLYRKP